MFVSVGVEITIVGVELERKKDLFLAVSVAMVLMLFGTLLLGTGYMAEDGAPFLISEAASRSVALYSVCGPVFVGLIV